MDTLSLPSKTLQGWMISNNSFFEEHAKLPAVSLIIDEIGNLYVDDAIAYANNKANVSKSEISFLGFSINSNSAQKVASIIFLALVCYIMSYLTEILNKYNVTPETKEWFPFIKNLYAKIFTAIVVLIFPVFSILAFSLTFFSMNNFFSWLFLLISISSSIILLVGYIRIFKINLK